MVFSFFIRFFVFFFKQKTAYEMRISDWSSDVCSSDLDRDFIAAHTSGFEALRADLAAADWGVLEARSGLDRPAMESIAEIYARSERVIICYGMGVTQHRHGTGAVQQIANLLLLRGNFGREGAGICPLRGHSNVQGDRKSTRLNSSH